MVYWFCEVCFLLYGSYSMKCNSLMADPEVKRILSDITGLDLLSAVAIDEVREFHYCMKLLCLNWY